MKPLNLDPNVDYLSQYTAPVDIPEWRKSLGSFASETKALGSGLKALGAQALGAEETRDEALADYQRNMDEASSGWKTPEVGRIEDIKLTEDGGVGRFGAYLAHTVPKGIAQLGALALGGGVAGGVAKATASTAIKQLAKQGVKKSAEKLVKRQLAAAGGAVAAGGFGMETGQSYGQFATDPEIGPEKAVGPALAYGGVASVLEFMPIAAGAKAIGLNRMLLRKVIKADPELSKKVVKLSLKKRALKVAGKVGGAAAAGAGVEGITEGMQSLAQLAAERYAKEDPEWASIVPRTPEEWSGFWNEAAAGAATGFFAGAATGPFTGTPQAKQPVPEPQPESVQEPIVPDAQAPLTPTQTPTTPPVDLSPEVPGVVAPQTDPEAQPETTQEPVADAVIPEAAPDESLVDYVLRASENGVPPAVYDKLHDAATEAGVVVTEEMQPQDVVDAIKARRGDVVVHTTSPQEASQETTEAAPTAFQKEFASVIQPKGETSVLPVQENPETTPEVPKATPSPTQAEELQWSDNQLFPEKRRDEAALELDAIAPDSKMAKSKEVLEASTIGTTIFPEEMVEALKIIEEAYTRGRTSSGIDLKYIQGSIEDNYGQGALDSLNAIYEKGIAELPQTTRASKSESIQKWLDESTEQTGQVDVVAGLEDLSQEDSTPEGWTNKPNSFGAPTWYPGEFSSGFVQKVTNPEPDEAYLAATPNGKVEYFATQKEAVDALTDSLQAEARPDEGDSWVAERDPTTNLPPASGYKDSIIPGLQLKVNSKYAQLSDGITESPGLNGTLHMAIVAATDEKVIADLKKFKEEWADSPIRTMEVHTKLKEYLTTGDSNALDLGVSTPKEPTKAYTKIGGQQGSNKGGWYLDSEKTQFYIKEPKSLDHGMNEQLAQILYAVTGVPTPVVSVESSVPGLKGPVLASKKVTGYDAKVPLKDGFVVDAWLGNWDVVGDDGKNYIKSGENAIRIDFGGALKYRAQGGLKGESGTKPFGNLATELATMRDPAINPMTAKAFEDITDADIIEQANALRKSISPEQISGIVDAPLTAFGGKKIEGAEKLAKTLIARRQYILDYAATLQEKGDVSSLQGWMKDWNASDPTKIEDALLATNPHDLVWAEIPSKNSRYGVLVINPADGKVLMREPTNHYDGYNWTFSKGGKNSGEHPLEAAKRETKEETGVDTTIVGMVGKPFYSSSSTGAVFYVGVSKGTVETIGEETQSTKWMSYGEARRSIKEGSNKGGVARDLEILEYLFGKKQVDDVAEYPIQKGAIHAKAFYESGEFASSFPASPFKHKDWGTLTKLQKLNVATASRLVKAAGDTGSVSGAEVVKAVNTIKTAFKNWSGVMLSKTTKGDVDYGKPESAWKIKTGVPVVIEGYHGTKQKGIVGDQLDIRGHAGSGVGGADTTFDGGAFFTFGKKKQAKSAGSKVYEFYISFKNPKVINYNGGYTSSKLISEISEAKANGYDGLIAQNIQDLGGKGTQFITWHRNQIKTRELENLGYSSDKTSKIYESQDSEADTPTKATTSFVATTDAALGQGWTQRAIDAGLLVVNEKSPKGSASGSFNPTTNKLTINLDKVPPHQTMVDVLLHEGSHAGLEVMLGDQFKGFHSDLLKLVGMGDPTAVLAIERATWGSINAINKHREKVGLEAFPHRVKDKTLPEGERKAELERVRKLIDELNPRLLPEEDLAYYVQTASSTAPTSAGFWNRLKRALQAWFAGTDFGKALAGIGWRPELAPDLAVALAKAATRQTLVRVEAEIQLVGARSKVLRGLSAGQSAALLESVPEVGVELVPDTDSTGQLVHPTPEGRANFKKWFNESKVVDESKRPVQLYRGTAQLISQRSNKGWYGTGYYYTADPDYAGTYPRDSFKPDPLSKLNDSQLLSTLYKVVPTSPNPKMEAAVRANAFKEEQDKYTIEYDSALREYIILEEGNRVGESFEVTDYDEVVSFDSEENAQQYIDKIAQDEADLNLEELSLDVPYTDDYRITNPAGKELSEIFGTKEEADEYVNELVDNEFDETAGEFSTSTQGLLKAAREKAKEDSVVKAPVTGRHIQPVYAALKNPLVLNSPEDLTILGFAKDELNYTNKDFADEITKRAKAQGYDGVIKHTPTKQFQEVVVFDLNQTKSAIGNRGTFTSDTALADQVMNSMPSVDEWGDSKTWLTSATSTMPEDYNVPGVFNKAFHGMVDRFDYVKGKSLDLYRAFDEWKNRQGALQQEIQRIYLDPMRHLVSRYQPTEADAEPIRRAQVAAGVDKAKYTDVEIAGHQLAARHILEDKVTEKLALKAAPEFLKELKKELSPHNVGLLNNAIKAMTGDSIAIDELTTPQARQLFETYLSAKKPDSDIATRWELYNRRSAGYSIAQPGTKAAKEDTAAGFINAHELYTPQVKNREIFKQIGELSDQLAAHQLKLLQEGGVLEQSGVDKLSSTYKHYVPLRREAFDYDQELKEMFEKPVANVGKLMTRKGSIELPSAVHVLQNHLASGFTAASAAARNQMMNKFADEIYKDRKGWESWFYIKDGRVHKNDVGFIRNGKALYIVPAEGNLRAASIVKVIAGKDAQDLSGPLKIMRSVNNWIRWSNVSASPAFMLANTPRDYLTAVYNLQASDAKDYVKEIASLKAYKESFKALHKVMVQGVRESDDPQVQEWIDLVESFERAGGKTSFVEALRAMDGGSWKSFEAQVKRRKGKLGGVVEFGADQLERIENLNIVLENVMRLSTYKVMRNKYQTDPKFNGMTQLQAEERAAEIARNLTTNFTRRGAHIDAMNTWWLFYNATVQGNWQVVQNLFLNPNKAGQRKLQKAVAGTILFAFLIDQLGRALSDDEDDDGVSDWDARTGHEKDRKISAPFSVGGVFPAIPAPWVFNVFWRLGGMLGEVKDGVLAPQDAVLDTMGLMFTSMNPISSGTPAQAIAPSAFDPFMQIIENRNFVGNPLGPDGFPGSTTRPDSYLAWDSTPAGYKHVAEFVNDVTGGSPVESGEADFRPSSYKVLTEFALGSLGRTIVDLGKLGLSPVMDGMDFEGPEKVPGLKVFLTAPSDSTAISHYHDRVAKVLGAKRLTKLYSAGVDKDSEKLAEVQRDRAAVLRMVPQVEDTERQIRSLRKAIRSARGNSRTEETLRNRIVQLQKRFNQSYTRRIGN